MNEDFGKRLKKIRTLLNLNQKNIGKRLKVPLTTISKYERTEIRPSAAFLTRLCIEFNTNINWLLTGNGSPFITDQVSTDNFSMKLTHLPIYDISKDFERDDLTDKKNILKYRTFSINWLISDPKIQPRNLILISLSDNSMFPNYNPGDLIYCDISKKEDRSDGLYLINIGKRLFLRRIQYIKQNTFMIIPDNSKYKTLYSNKIKTKVIGKAVWSSHSIKD